MTRGTLKSGEPHPSYEIALRIISNLGLEDRAILMESFSSCAIGGNRLAEVCAETLRRIMDRDPVSDRYLMGLILALPQEQQARSMAKEYSSLRKVALDTAYEIEAALGPEPPDCGCQGCKVEMQMALEAAARLRDAAVDS